MNEILDSSKRRQFETGAINSDYIKLAQLAYDTVLQTMLEGEKQHSPDGWKDNTIRYHLDHANEHLFNFEYKENIAEALIDLEHCLTRLSMIKFLQNKID